MLIHADFLRVIWGVTADRILHIGAHEAEELEDYSKQGWEGVCLLGRSPAICRGLT